jgi:hypothetical protein
MQLEIYIILKICYRIVYLLGYLKILFTLQWSFEKQHSYATLVELKLLFNGKMQRSKLFFQIYTYLGSDFSTLIENRNNFFIFSSRLCEIFR